ncbi:MAG TPA: sulfate ABC transporter substrate-binding protein [Chloroflexota bacterium]|nr:sulfate ABC transporter substrate-binding protein [Chloroflexota bacterium]
MIRSKIVRLISLASVVVMANLGGLGRTTVAAPARAGTTLSLVAYSTPQQAYGQLIPAFQATAAGKDVSFHESFGASGSQSQLVAQGLPADVVEFSLEPDMGRLVNAGIVSANWYKNAYHGFVTDSAVVFGVRPGNPKHIHTWADLIRAGVSVLTPNPFTSGGARWNVMAAYGAMIKQHKTRAQALAYLRQLFRHVAVQDDSARHELQTFDAGKGDVMLAYENDMITAKASGEKLDWIMPPQTILIENPLAWTLSSKSPNQARAFVKWLWSPAAQQIWGQNGYWPVVPSVRKHFSFTRPKTTLFTIRDFGTWTKVQKTFFDPATGLMVDIEKTAGSAAP